MQPHHIEYWKEIKIKCNNMKSIFLSLAILVGALMSVNAQTSDVDHSFEFIDASGDIVSNGSIINRTDVEEDLSGEPCINSGLYVKNISDVTGNVTVQLTVASLPSGSFQICFPALCSSTESGIKVGSPFETAYKTMTAGESLSLQSEWLVEEGKYGTCQTTYRLKVYKVNANTFELEFYANGSSVTVNHIYADPAGINANMADKKLNSITYYDLSGRRVSEPVSGVYVKKMTYADGTVKTNKISLK